MPIFVVLAYLAFWAALVAGYVMNVVALIGSSFEPLTGFVVARIVGVVVPFLGAVLGWF